MIDKVIRLFKMLNAIQANPGITAKELAVKCDTAERTIYRDLRVLDLIAPITNEGYGKGYTFIYILDNPDTLSSFPLAR